MKVLIVAVGKRTEHWESFFEALARRTHLELFLHAADISALARHRLGRLGQRYRNVTFHEAQYRIGEDATGHMASVVFANRSWRWLHDVELDVIHVIGEAAYLSTYQTIRFRNRVFPQTPISLYAAQNVVMKLPPPFSTLERFAYKQVALTLPITPAALRVLRAKGYRGEARITPLGVDLTRFRPRHAAPNGPFTVGFVGRFETHKGMRDLVSAVDMIGGKLLVVGNGSLRAWLEGERARRGRIEIHPWQDHHALARLLHRMHALVLPSVEVVQRGVVPWRGIPLREQFGRVLLEAMACGIPVIGTTVGEIPYVVGRAGLTVPPGSPAELAKALMRLRDHPAFAASLARMATERASLFDWNLIAEGVHRSWQDLTRLRVVTTLPSDPQVQEHPWYSEGESHGRAV